MVSNAQGVSASEMADIGPEPLSQMRVSLGGPLRLNQLRIELISYAGENVAG